MEKFTTRQRYLKLKERKRKAALMGEKYTFSRKSSSKFRKIRRNNDMILKKLRDEAKL